MLSHEPAGAERTIAWVGKGIVYDTGGLALKPKVELEKKLVVQAGIVAAEAVILIHASDLD